MVLVCDKLVVCNNLHAKRHLNIQPHTQRSAYKINTRVHKYMAGRNMHTHMHANTDCISDRLAR